MNRELVAGINAVAAERGLDVEIIFSAIEAALVSTYKNRNGVLSNVVAQVDRVTGEVKVFVEKEVAEEILDDRTMITLEEARELDPEVDYEDLVLVEFTPSDIGRIAVGTAKQVIVQRIREAERSIIYEMFKDRVGEIVSAQVRSVDFHSKTVTVTMNDRSEFLLKREEQIPNDRLRRGDYVKLYVERVERDNRGPYVKLSRTHRNLLRRLLEQEIPELREGTIEIKNIVREPGARSKVAVSATVENVDPVGSCVGIKGSRIKNIVSELAGERIDVVEWSDEPHTFIVNAISPAKATGVVLHAEGTHQTATVVASSDQLSLAIGKSGQNARLAARLTGWRIDIKSEAEAQAEGIDLFELQQNMIRHDQLAAAGRRLAQTQTASGDNLDQAAQILAAQDTHANETASSDILLDAFQAASNQSLEQAEEKWNSAAREQQSGQTPLQHEDDGNDVFRRAAQKALEQMTYEEFTESHDAGAPDLDDAAEADDGDAPSELPDVITADMLRAQSGPAMNLDDIEVPAELLEGYGGEADDASPAAEEDEEPPAKRRGPAPSERRKDSPDATRFGEWMED